MEESVASVLLPLDVVISDDISSPVNSRGGTLVLFVVRGRAIF